MRTVLSCVIVLYAAATLAQEREQKNSRLSKMLGKLGLDSQDIVIEDIEGKLGLDPQDIEEGGATEVEAATLEQEDMCKVDGVAPDPVSQNKVDKFIQRFQGRPMTKILRKLIMRKLRDKNSRLSKMLGKLAQDPQDEDFEEGEVGATEAAPAGLMKMLSKFMGETRTVVGYLWAFGFFAKVLNKSPRQADNYNGTIPSCAITQAVMEFQKFNQLPADGRLTKRTRELMAMDRCGNPDVKCETDECLADEDAVAAEGDSSGLARKKRYALYSRKWKTNEMDLTYYFYNYTTDMPQEKCRSEIEKGLKEWADVSPFSFTEVDNPDDAKFKIFFASRDHFDGHQFDGPWGVLAHAFYPRKGKLHYDEDETFTADTADGVNLYYATTHEMGHGLGLMHSSSYGAVMAPYYPGYKPDIELTQDDLDAIHIQYGVGKGKVTPLTKNTDGIDEESQREKEQQERERLEKEEQERLEKEQQEKERLEKEEKERLEKEEKERLEKEEKERVEKEEEERLEKERQEREQQEKEQLEKEEQEKTKKKKKKRCRDKTTAKWCNKNKGKGYCVGGKKMELVQEKCQKTCELC